MVIDIQCSCCGNHESLENSIDATVKKSKAGGAVADLRYTARNAQKNGKSATVKDRWATSGTHSW